MRVYYSCRHRAGRQASPLAVLWMNSMLKGEAPRRLATVVPRLIMTCKVMHSAMAPWLGVQVGSEKETTSRRHPMNDLLFGRAVLQLLLSTLICIGFAEDRLAQGAFAYKRAQPARGRIFALKAIRGCR